MGRCILSFAYSKNKTFQLAAGCVLHIAIDTVRAYLRALQFELADRDENFGKTARRSNWA